METFISSHPGVVAAFIGLLLSAVGTLVLGYWAWVGKRLEKLETTDAHLEERVGTVEEELVKYAEHVGAGDKIFGRLQTSIGELSGKLSSIHEDNLKAHTTIVERLARVETKMPNGELAEVLRIVKGLALGR